MSEGPGEERGIGDEDLPDDLKPGEDNPLAEGLGDAETPGDLGPGELLEEGKPAEQWDGDNAAERSSGQGEDSDEG